MEKIDEEKYVLKIIHCDSETLIDISKDTFNKIKYDGCKYVVEPKKPFDINNYCYMNSRKLNRIKELRKELENEINETLNHCHRKEVDKIRTDYNDLFNRCYFIDGLHRIR